MMNWEKFLEQHKDIIEFPLKKFLSVVKSSLINKIKIGENIFQFDFLQEKTLPISFFVKINFQTGNPKYSGKIIKNEVFQNEYKNFGIYIQITDSTPEYNQILSIINHELKHVYDLYYGNYKDSFDRVEPYNYLKFKYQNYPDIIHFLEVSNLALEHELEARNSMIYDKLRWLKTFDKKQLEEEFHKSYIKKALDLIKEWDYNKITKLSKSIEFTNEYIKLFLNSNDVVNSKLDLLKFYTEAKTKFNKTADDYLIKCSAILDELVRDKKPYMEEKLFDMTDDFSLDGNKPCIESFIRDYYLN